MARLQVLLAALCFGTTGTAQALGPGGIDPAAVGAARILVGGAVLVVVAAAMPRRAAARGPSRAAAGGGPRRAAASVAARRWALRPVLAGAAGVAAYQA